MKCSLEQILVLWLVNGAVFAENIFKSRMVEQLVSPSTLWTENQGVIALVVLLVLPACWEPQKFSNLNRQQTLFWSWHPRPVVKYDGSKEAIWQDPVVGHSRQSGTCFIFFLLIHWGDEWLLWLVEVAPTLDHYYIQVRRSFRKSRTDLRLGAGEDSQNLIDSFFSALSLKQLSISKSKSIKCVWLCARAESMDMWGVPCGKAFPCQSWFDYRGCR